jgi:NTE family protein
VATADGRLLVDGGVLDNLPVAAMARTGEGPVIAVDVTGRAGESRPTARPRLRRISGATRRLLTGSEVPIPRLAETIVRTVLVGSADTVASARLHADMVISPASDGIGLMDWEALSHVRELGRAAARQALEAQADVIRGFGA